MKKLTLILLISLGIFSLLKSQTVDSIKIEQSGELIKIHYKILNSNQYQTFKVAVSAKLNDGLESKLVSLIGDVGDAVKGGKDNYIIIWDVLKDVDEVKSADFSVKAELMKDETPKVSKNGKRNPLGGGLYVMGIVQTPKTGFGGRIGYMRGWGFSMAFVPGKKATYSEVPNLYAPEFAVGIDLTKRIVNKESFKMHLYGGVLLSTYPEYFNVVENRYWKDHFSGIDIGLVCSTKMLAFSGGIGTLQNSELSAYLGLGVRF